MLLLGLNSFAQIINVSTGVDNSGNALAVGVNDPNWQIVSNTTPKVCGYHGAWQPTPISGSNAGWINDTGVYYASNPAIYTFERPFSIAAGTTSLTCNFGITTDDFIVSLELVRPDSSTIPLTIPASPAYTVSPAITNVISSPMAGTWKIRVVTNFLHLQLSPMRSKSILILTNT